MISDPTRDEFVPIQAAFSRPAYGKIKRMKFRKRPVVIEAVRVKELVENAQGNWRALPDWIREAYEKGDILFGPTGMFIRTREGKMRGELDDWIIRGVAGELYPCKPDIFEATYTPETADNTATVG